MYLGVDSRRMSVVGTGGRQHHGSHWAAGVLSLSTWSGPGGRGGCGAHQAVAPTKPWHFPSDMRDYSKGCCPLSLVDQNFLSVSTTVPVACTFTLLFLATTLSPAPSVTTVYVVLTPGIACDGSNAQDQPICRWPEP